MDFIFNFFSSIFLGLGAALLLAAVAAVLFIKVFNLDYLRTGLLALFLLIFGGYQMVLLVGASSVRGLVDQAATAAEITSETLDEKAADAICDIPGVSSFVDKNTIQSVGTFATIARRIDESIGDYIMRRSLWLIGFCAAALIAALLMRPRRPAPMPDIYGGPAGGSGPAGGGYDLNF